MAEKNFEKIMGELEETVKKLESGDISLEESLGLFEKGVTLSKQCQKMLDEAEKKVSVLLSGADGEKVKEDFVPDEQ